MNQIEPIHVGWRGAAGMLTDEWTENMDDQRDVQVSKRNGSSKSFISAGSAVDMEIKRKKIRQSALFLPTEVRLKRLKTVWMFYANKLKPVSIDADEV